MSDMMPAIKTTGEHSKQCILEKPAPEGGVRLMTTWIPERFAVVGRYLKLLEDGIWEDGWKVVGIGARKQSAIVHHRTGDCGRQRRASDI